MGAGVRQPGDDFITFADGLVDVIFESRETPRQFCLRIV
jgi:hypothetical protein